MRRKQRTVVIGFYAQCQQCGMRFFKDNSFVEMLAEAHKHKCERELQPARKRKTK